MIHTDRHLHRRTVLGSIAGSTVLPLAGCTGAPDGQGESDGAIRDVTVSEMQLVVTLREDASVDGLTVIQPDGSEFATRSVAAGVTRETIDLGMPYSPGEYEVHAIADEETVDEASLDIRPDVRITDLKLGRNHPDEMYEGASDQAIRSEAIVTVENHGTGPDAVTQLRFEGDVPQPTPNDFEESGIYDTESGLHEHREKALITVDEEENIFSFTQPFGSSGSNISCGPETVEGRFSVKILTELSKDSHRKSYNVEYTGEGFPSCNVRISEVEP
ncbi:hypothetical protein HUG10_16190 [Halorarum halophilum]|uniref:Uncharacterized protein n=1 Tax=Halorarum halophilum TaxID=2743090 RepID=A0A7D5KVI2_9EURY|nr:hypothetical protein [Halobaculum halophilum]QLG28980.1 hypothetical protein HUG10_16190 [Halobaculum halophilum]